MIRPNRAPALLSIALALIGLAPADAPALVLDSGDGSGNREAPADDPGWAHVGWRLGGPSLIYLGHGWVLTAHHVGAGVVVIGGSRYDPIRGTLEQLGNPDGSLADLLLFRIAGNPDLPDLPLLPIGRSPPQPGEPVVMIGAGRSRGGIVTMKTVRGPIDGWRWRSSEGLRWGTNTIATRPAFLDHGGTRTRAFATIFERIDDPSGTPHEAQAAEGDSGGALFARRDRLDPSSRWVLAGVMFSIRSWGQQALPRIAFYGDATFSADLSYYRDQIIAVVRSECGRERDGGGSGTPNDSGCESAGDPDETGGGPGLLLPALAGAALLVIAALIARRWALLYSGVT